MNWITVLAGSTIGFAALGYILEALFGNHDPGTVFPWSFVAVMMAFAGGFLGFAVGLILDLLNLIFRWW